MEKRNLIDGMIGFSNIVLGCDHFGETLKEEEVKTLLDYYYNSGGNVFDTAASYSMVEEGSQSEKILGSWIKEKKLKNKTIIITKGGRDLDSNPELYKRNVIRDFEKSFKQLGFYPDIWFLHRDNPYLEVKTIAKIVTSVLKDTGVVLGLSNWTGKRIREYMSLENVIPVKISEIQYSLATTTSKKWGDSGLVIMNEEEKEFYSKSKIPVICYSSQGKGYYSKIASSLPLREKAKIRFDSSENRSKLKSVLGLMEKYSISASAVVTSYIYSQKGINCLPIVGAGKLEQLEQTLKNSSFLLSQKELDFLEKN
ncbi:MAG: aldo/keto reductase [Sphaerochaetaceae bacterium]|nr:aldo/keto reductase [Sphaerochaetaceae bacterium]